MNKILFEDSAIFRDMTSDEISSLDPIIRNYSKESVIINEGDEVKFMGTVLEGVVDIFKTTYDGNRLLLFSGNKGFVFGESISVLNIPKYPVSVRAESDCCILFISSSKLKSCKNTQFLLNIMSVMAKIGIEYRKKITILEQRSTEDKLLTYLMYEAKKNNNPSFDIPYDRQNLADYLGVDRSAMSAVISRLIHENKIKSSKNHFEIIRREQVQDL